MKTKKEIMKWLLTNCIDVNGDLYLSHLDFTKEDFDGDVYISDWKINGYLFQRNQIVHGDLYQDNQKVTDNLYQDNQKVEGYLYQSGQILIKTIKTHKCDTITCKECDPSEGWLK